MTNLRNELDGLTKIIGQFEKLTDVWEPDLLASSSQLESDVKTVCAKARQSWALAIFSNVGEDVLERYFNYHVRILSDCLSSLPANKETVFQINPNSDQVDQHKMTRHELVELLDHLYRFYSKYIDTTHVVPSGLQSRLIQDFRPFGNDVLHLLEVRVSDNELKIPLATYLQYMGSLDDQTVLTFGEINYFQKLLMALDRTLNSHGKPGSDQMLEKKLIELNFNHLQIFAYMQQKIRREIKGKTARVRLAGYRKQVIEVNCLNKSSTDAYDFQRPSLHTMLETWLRAEILVLEHNIQQTQDGHILPETAKLRLALSMPRLACLIKLFHKTSLQGEISLEQIFKFVAAHFSTKQQPSISPKSLSKEYYALDMYTAAKVRGLLKDMIVMIDESFSWQ